MTKPPKLGTVNGFVQCVGFFGKKRFDFDGTILGLTKSALRAGAKAGDTVRAEFCNSFEPYLIESVPWDDRASGCWAKRVIPLRAPLSGEKV